MSMAAHARRWTLEEMHALPESSTKYELVDGELWVTPAPTVPHETILARLTRILDPFVEAQRLGFVYRARAVFRVGRTLELEPDLMVRRPPPDPDADWENAPLPTLVVEVVSRSSRRRDYGRKRELYMHHGIAEYWVIDAVSRSVTVVRQGHDSHVVTDLLAWTPPGAAESLVVDAARLFG